MKCSERWIIASLYLVVIFSLCQSAFAASALVCEAPSIVRQKFGKSFCCEPQLNGAYNCDEMIDLPRPCNDKMKPPTKWIIEYDTNDVCEIEQCNGTKIKTPAGRKGTIFLLTYLCKNGEWSPQLSFDCDFKNECKATEKVCCLEPLEKIASHQEVFTLDKSCAPGFVFPPNSVALSGSPHSGLTAHQARELSATVLGEEYAIMTYQEPAQNACASVVEAMTPNPGAPSQEGQVGPRQ